MKYAELGSRKAWESIYKGESHKQKPNDLLYFVLLFPGAETYCHVLRLFPAFVTYIEHKLSSKTKVRKGHVNRTTCFLSQTFIHLVNTSSSSLGRTLPIHPHDALELLPHGRHFGHACNKIFQVFPLHTTSWGHFA